MSANEQQVGGEHYKADEGMQARAADVDMEKVPEHWDLVHIFGMDYFQAQITRYVLRHKKKNGLEDLKKAQHFLAKYIEIKEAELGRGESEAVQEEEAVEVHAPRRVVAPVKNRFRQG